MQAVASPSPSAAQPRLPQPRFGLSQKEEILKVPSLLREQPWLCELRSCTLGTQQRGSAVLGLQLW